MTFLFGLTQSVFTLREGLEFLDTLYISAYKDGVATSACSFISKVIKHVHNVYRVLSRVKRPNLTYEFRISKQEEIYLCKYARKNASFKRYWLLKLQNYRNKRRRNDPALKINKYRIIFSSLCFCEFRGHYRTCVCIVKQ